MIVGCERGPARIPIHGTVTFKGVPIAQGTIEFIPKDGATTREGASIVAGKYATLPEHGLLVGEYHVSITATEPVAKVAPNTPPGVSKWTKGLIPEEYNRDSKLTVEITAEGKREFDFNLD